MRKVVSGELDLNWHGFIFMLSNLMFNKYPMKLSNV